MQDVLAGAVGGGGVEAFTRDAVLLALRQPEAAPRGSEERERTSLAIGAGRGGVEARAHGAGRPCGAERRRWERAGPLKRVITWFSCKPRLVKTASPDYFHTSFIKAGTEKLYGLVLS